MSVTCGVASIQHGGGVRGHGRKLHLRESDHPTEVVNKGKGISTVDTEYKDAHVCEVSWCSGECSADVLLGGLGRSKVRSP